jgi:hypothetical protein
VGRLPRLKKRREFFAILERAIVRTLFALSDEGVDLPPLLGGILVIGRRELGGSITFRA